MCVGFNDSSLHHFHLPIIKIIVSLKNHRTNSNIIIIDNHLSLSLSHGFERPSEVVPVWKALLLVLTLCAIFSISLSKMNDTTNYDQILINSEKPKPSKSHDYTFHFAIHGNVYPLGYYTVKVAIGNPPKLYDLQIDSGSDLTWVQSKPYDSCPPGSKYNPYNPNNNLQCNDPLCGAPNKKCGHFPGPCNYTMRYADGLSCSGVLVKDFISFRLDDDSIIRHSVGFGSGVDIKHQHPLYHNVHGLFGLGHGKIGILSQLSSLGYIRNVFGHCLSSKGGGRLFLGDDKTSKSFIWIPILKTTPHSLINHYRAGPVDILFDGKQQIVKGDDVIFDSGSTYTHLNRRAYKALLDRINNDIGKKLQRAMSDHPWLICWKGQNLFGYFKNIVLNFPKTNSQFILTPQSYLIVSVSLYKIN
ncbi:hypothetical protein PIB30_051912 [Stylosanthes scabra]|uniref:Peptidase A1 domain-containing protein n=1 Tax=Stylosanthes scabra TaxID=79078 RepID=A0ABU6QHL3_9FABA|nr:hypothetical protein [Stylosanthes scabra]